MSRILHLTNSATSAECRRWIERLHANGLLYHFDDDPAGIGIFTNEECVEIRRAVKILFKRLADPFVVAIELVNSETS